MDKFETDVYTLILHDNNLREFIVKKDALLKEKDVWESRDVPGFLNPSKKLFVLIELSEGSRVTANARRAVASDEYFNYVAALAIYSGKVYESIRATLFSKVHRPKVPTRSFDNKQQALDWLRLQAAATG